MTEKFSLKSEKATLRQRLSSHLNGTLQVNCRRLVHPWNQKKTASLNENVLLLLTDSESPRAVRQEQLIDQIFLCLFYFLFSQAQGIFHLTIPASHLSPYTAYEQCAQQGEDSRPRRPPIHPTLPISFPTYLTRGFHQMILLTL